MSDSEESYAEDEEEETTEDSDASSKSEKDSNNTGPGCIHYKRRCLFVSPCCAKIYPCRVCHDENSDHTLDRHKVEEIICSVCNTRQKVSKRCVHCDISFGRYFCAICRLYDNTQKGQFHCEGCGICRVGGRRNFFHCNVCGLCLGISLKDNHKCIQDNSRQNCPVCLEDIHTSRDQTNVSACGHLMHSKCYRTFLKKGEYRCPICGVSLGDMNAYWEVLDQEIAETPMPPEYADMLVWILCKDCHEVSHVRFHVLGLKCIHCGSYNTCNTAAPTSLESEV